MPTDSLRPSFWASGGNTVERPFTGTERARLRVPCDLQPVGGFGVFRLSWPELRNVA